MGSRRALEGGKKMREAEEEGRRRETEGQLELFLPSSSKIKEAKLLVA